jgi:hypothetical protein
VPTNPDASRAVRFVQEIQPPVDGGYGEAPSSDLPSTLQAVVQANPIVVLLGEPGSGKSWATSALNRHLNSVGHSVRLDLRGKSERDLEAQLGALSTSAHPIGFALLDSADETRARIPALVRILRAVLPSLLEAGWRFLIACRTAELSPLLDSALKSIAADAREDSDEVRNFVVQVHLSPLTEAEVADIALDSGVDSTLFLDAVRQARVETLAASPLTLKMLIERFALEGELPAERSELYESSVRIGLESTGRVTAWHLPEEEEANHPTFGYEHLRAAAGWLASLLVLSGHSEISLGTADTENRWDRLTLAHPAHGGAAFDLPLIKAVLLSGLFANSGPDERTFAHRSIAEYLCASYLSELEPEKAQLRTLMLLPEPVGTVPETLVGTATWLVRKRPAAHAWLVEASPLPLIASGAVLAAEHLKMTAAHTLFKESQQSMTLARWNTTFASLQSQAVADYLVMRLRDGNTRALALRVLRDVVAPDAIPEIQKIALNRRLPLRDRIEAIGRLSDLGAVDGIAMLGEDPGNLLDQDDQQDARAALIEALWPTHMSTERLAELLVEPSKFFYGSYQAFIYELPEIASQSDLLKLIRTLSASWDDDEPPLTYTASRDPDDWEVGLLRKLVEKLDWSQTSPAEYIWKAIALIVEGSQHRLPISRSMVGEDLWSHFLSWIAHEYERLDEPFRPWMLPSVADGSSMLTGADRGWLLNRASSTTSQVLRDSLVDTWHVLDAAETSDDVPTEMVALVESRRPVPDRPATVRRPRRGGRRPPKLEPTTLEDVRQSIGRSYEDPGQFWVLFLRIRAIGERRDSDRNPLSDALDGLTEPDKAKILHLASAYLAWLPTDPEYPDVMDDSHLYWKAEAGFWALSWLLDRDLEIPAQSWTFLARTVVFHRAYADNERNLKRRLLSHLALDTGDSFPDAVQGLLDAARRGLHPDSRILDLEGAVSAATVSLLIAFLEGPWTANHPYVLELLKGRDLVEVERWARGLLSTSKDPEELSHAWVHIASRRAVDAIEAFATLRARGKTLAQDVALRVAARERFGAVFETDPAQTARLWELLYDLFPPREDPAVQGVHSVSPREDAGDWRNRLLNRLISFGTLEAVQVLEDLHVARPEMGLEVYVVLASENTRANGSTGASIEDLRWLLDGSSRRLLRSAGDLHEIVLEQLRTIAGWLTGQTPQLFALWNTHKQGDVAYAAPKIENDISDWYLHGLKLLLGTSQSIVNREVEVSRRPGTSSGERTDIQIEAFDRAGRRLVEIIEVKGAWNAELDSAMQLQLVERYMRPAGARYGVYLIVWGDRDAVSDSNRHPKSDLGKIRSGMRKQAASLSPREIVEAVVHDITPKAPRARRRPRASTPS